MELKEETEIRFGIIIRKWRTNDKKLTISQASQKTGIVEIRLKALELGKAYPTISFREVHAIAKAYEIDLSIVYGMAIGSEIL